MVVLVSVSVIAKVETISHFWRVAAEKLSFRLNHQIRLIFFGGIDCDGLNFNAYVTSNPPYLTGLFLNIHSNELG